MSPQEKQNYAYAFGFATVVSVLMAGYGLTYDKWDTFYVSTSLTFIFGAMHLAHRE